MQKRDEQSGADDRPHDRKRLPAQLQLERLGHAELVCDPRPEEGADETEGDGDDNPAPRSACDRPADSAADGGDDDQYDES